MVSLFSCGYGTKDNEDDSFASVPVNTDPEVLACFTQVNAFRTGSEIKPDLQLSSNPEEASMYLFQLLNYQILL